MKTFDQQLRAAFSAGDLHGFTNAANGVIVETEAQVEAAFERWRADLADIPLPVHQEGMSEADLERAEQQAIKDDADLGPRHPSDSANSPAGNFRDRGGW